MVEVVAVHYHGWVARMNAARPSSCALPVWESSFPSVPSCRVGALPAKYPRRIPGDLTIPKRPVTQPAERTTLYK